MAAARGGGGTEFHEEMFKSLCFIANHLSAVTQCSVPALQSQCSIEIVEMKNTTK